MYESDEDVIGILNSGSVLFTKISQCDKKLPTFEQLHICVTLHSGDQKKTRNLFLKGEFLISENQGSGSPEARSPPAPLSPPVNEISPNKQIEQQPEVHVPEIANDIQAYGSELPKASNQCNLCEEAFIYKRDLEEHMNHIADCTIKRSYKCKKCGKAFIDNEEFMLHMFIHTGEKPFPCSQCDKAFLQKSDLKKHMGTHTETYNLERPYRCNMCEKGFTYKHELKIHMSIHLRESPCHNGGYTFKDKGAFKRIKLLNFEQIADHNRERSYQCKKCNKTFSYKQELIMHLCIQTRKIVYPCNQCNKSFVQNSDLKKHMEIHMGPNILKIYQCSLCIEAFKDKHKLEEHIMMIHIGEMPFQCNLCDKGFFKKHNLEYHMNIHNKETLYQCKQCFKAFYQRIAFDNHMETHNEEKSYQCYNCCNAFLHNNIPKGDIGIEYEENQDKCSQCYRGLSQESSLISHTRLQTFETLKSVYKFDTEYLCEPKIEVKYEDIDMENNYTDPKIEVKEEEIDLNNSDADIVVGETPGILKL